MDLKSPWIFVHIINFDNIVKVRNSNKVIMMLINSKQNEISCYLISFFSSVFPLIFKANN